MFRQGSWRKEYAGRLAWAVWLDNRQTVAGVQESFGVRIGRVFGIDLYIRPAWLFVLGVLILAFARRIEGVEAYSGLNEAAVWIVAATAALGLYASVLVHEFGHALTARLFGIRTERISIHFFGAATYTARESETPREEFWIALAGPLASLATAMFLGSLAALFFAAPVEGSPWLGDFLAIACTMNLFLFGVNLAPGLPLDGGRILRAMVWGATGDYLRGTRTAAMTGRMLGCLAIGGGVLALVTLNSIDAIFAGLLGYFLIRMAKAAEVQAEVQAAFAHLAVRDMMRPVVAVIPADMLLGDVKSMYVERMPLQQLFPVVREDTLVGLLHAGALAGVEPRQLDWMRASELAWPVERGETIEPGTQLYDAFRRMLLRAESVIPVFEGKCLVGFLRRIDVLHFLNESGRKLP